MAQAKIMVIVLATLTFLLLSPLLLESRVGAASASEGDEWVYYGFSPRVNYTSYYQPVTKVLMKPSGRPANWLTVLGYNDSTHVSVYDITGGKEDLLDSFTVDRMKTYTSQLPMDGNFSVETFFRVVCDKPVAVLMSSGNLMETGVSVGGQNIFYPSTDGGFAGNEFVFVAVPATSLTAREGLDHAVFAVEDSTIQLRDKDDEILRTLNIAANSSKRLELFSNKVYRITSTGRIMISSWTMWSFTICPSPMGGYRGRVFLLNPDQRATYGSAVVLIVSQENPVEVDIYDMSSGSLLIEKSLQSREMWFINREVADLAGLKLMVQSDGEVIVYAGATLLQEGVSDSPGQIAKGITFVTVRADRPTTIFSVSDAYVFSPNGNAELRINGLTIVVPRGGYKNIPAGRITATSNETVTIQSISVVNYYEYARTFYQPAGLRSFSAYLLPANRLEVTYPPPKTGEAEPAGGYSLDLMLVAAVAGAAAILVGVLILKKKSKRVAALGSVLSHDPEVRLLNPARHHRVPKAHYLRSALAPSQRDANAPRL